MPRSGSCSFLAHRASAATPGGGSFARRWRRPWPLLAALLVAACTADGGGAAPLPNADPGKADDVRSTALAPDWLLAPEGQGVWPDERSTSGSFRLLRAWIDARVANVRYDKRLFAEVYAPYAGGAAIRLLVPLTYEGALAGNTERWGTDAIELYPDGGPHGATLAGPVLYRLRVQHDGGGGDRMLATDWRALHDPSDGSIPPAPPREDPWAPGLVSPRRPVASRSSPTLHLPPFDDAGAVVLAEIERVIESARREPGTRHTVHAAIFNINDPRITDRLIEAHRAGVEVRLIHDGRKVRPWLGYQTEDDRLLAAGVPLLSLRRADPGAMHLKFALFDGARVATGSFNWEVGASVENHEDMILLDDPAVVAQYAARFEALAGGVLSPRTALTDVDAATSVHFGPDENPSRAVGRLLDAARTSIHVAMFTAKDYEYDDSGSRASLFRKLVEAHHRGVHVVLMTDAGVAEGREYHGRTTPDDPTDEWLESEGITVVRADNPFGPYASMHHKLAVIDGELLLMGAFNWYYDAAFLNDEDVLVLRDRALAARAEGEIVDLLHRYDPGFDPARWPAVALTVSAEHGGTRWGEGVWLVGELEQLGRWDPARALGLDARDWPQWRGQLTLPAGLRFEAKLVVRAADGRVEWEPGDNRVLTVPTGVETADLSLAWGR